MTGDALRGFAICVVLLSGLLLFGLAKEVRADEVQSVAAYRQVSRTTCRLGDQSANLSVTIEIARETHAHRMREAQIASNVAELRNNLDAPHRVIPRDLQTASWRIVETTFAADEFFGERMRRTCEQGCALHEFASVDMRIHAFVAAPSIGANIVSDIEFSDLPSLYGAAQRALLSFVGFGEYQGFVIELPGAPQRKASCN